MKTAFYKSYLYIFIFLLISFDIKPQLQKKPWLFYAHIAAVNNLYPFVSSDIKEMQEGSNSNVNTLVLLNGLDSNYQRFTQRIVVDTNKITKETITPQDSGITSTLVNGVKWAISQAPHDYLAIDLWDHGSGILNPTTRVKRGVCFDDLSQNYLTDLNLRTAFKEIVNLRNGKKVDIIGFDACLMASLENCLTLSDYTNYIVASEETIPGLGWGYKTVLSSLINSIYPRNFAIAMVDSYKNTYKNVEADFTLSAIYTKNISQLAQSVNEVSKSLYNLLIQDKTSVNLIKKSLGNTVNYFEPYYVDLGNLLQNIINNLNKTKLRISKSSKNQLISQLNNTIQLIRSCVIRNAYGSSKPNSTGLSIYFPTDIVDSSYYKLFWSQKYPEWIKFLNKYLENI